MKLIYIANARIPTEKAHGIQIMKMCEAFSKSKVKSQKSKVEEGVEVELIVPRRINYIETDPFEYYGVERIFKIKKLPCLDLITLDKYIGRLGLWAEAFSFNFFAFPYLLFKKADIIYTRDKFFLFCVFFKRNLIYEAHTFPRNYFLYTPFLKRVKRIVTITQKLKDLFVEQGIETKKILVAPDGVDLEKFKIQDSRFKIREKLGLPQDKKIVLYTGHLYEWKGAQTLAEASQFLPEAVGVYFIGGTEKDVQEYKIRYTEYNIQIVGHRPHSEIPYWLCSADVLVLPNSAKQEVSRSWTSPLKLFEYMASKRPIVASDLPSIREILNENNAILVKPDDPMALAEGIKEVLENPVLAERISNQAFQDVQQYTWEKRAERIIKFISIANHFSL